MIANEHSNSVAFRKLAQLTKMKQSRCKGVCERERRCCVQQARLIFCYILASDLTLFCSDTVLQVASSLLTVYSTAFFSLLRPLSQEEGGALDPLTARYLL